MIAFRSKYPIFVAVIKFNLLKSNKMKKTFKTLSFCVSVLLLCASVLLVTSNRHVEAEL